jgi:hypothetical protein
MSPGFAVVLALACALAFPAVAAPAVPSPVNSSVDVSIPTSPDGTLDFNVVVRDLANNVVINSIVQIVFTDCAGFFLCTTCPDDYIVQPTSIAKITGVTGAAAFHVCAGGRCTTGQANVYADGVLLATRQFAPADQDGDLLVEPADVSAVQGLEGTTTASADLNHDGAVTAADTALAQARLGETCDNPTPSRSTTWGRVKTIYR